MIAKYEFEILNTIYKNGFKNQRELSEQIGLSLGTINKTFGDLVDKKLLSEHGVLTKEGNSVLSNYEVSNAIIMAAGMSSRFAPLSYENPKGLLKVKGDILIERQIEQLHEVGITDITLVLGYMKEKFFYLEKNME